MVKPYRILVTGWRDWPRESAWVIENALRRRAFGAGIPANRRIVVVDGLCPYGGADQWAHEWAVRHQDLNIGWERHPAARGPQGQLLGPARNTKMVKLGADVCLAFPGPGSRGTIDCMTKAENAGILVLTYEWSEKFRPTSPGTLDSTPMSP